MKLIVYICLLPLVFADLSCNYSAFQAVCTGFEISTEVPLPVNNTMRKVVLDGISGAIGVETLSNLQKVTELTIKNSKVNHVEDGALCSLPRLKELSIGTNQEFPVLTKEMLSGCDSLRSLRVDNQIEPDALTNLPKLKSFTILEGNSAPHFTKEYFEHLKEFWSLEIYQEGKADIDLACSLGLEGVDIKKNFPPITKAYFNNCSSLIWLTLSHTGDTAVDIEQDAISSTLPDLIVLELTNFNIGRLTRNFFKHISKLQILILCKSEINFIESDALQDLQNLNMLKMSENNLYDYDLKVFHNLNSLRILELSKNHLSSMKSMEGLPNLRTLNLIDNDMTSVDMKYVKEKFPKLTKIAADNNPLYMVEDGELSVRLKLSF